MDLGIHPGEKGSDQHPPDKFASSAGSGSPDLISSSQKDAEYQENFRHRGGMGQPVGAENNPGLGAGDYEVMDGSTGLCQHIDAPGSGQSLAGDRHLPGGVYRDRSGSNEGKYNVNGHSSLGQFDRHNWDSPPRSVNSDKRNTRSSGHNPQANSKPGYLPHTQGAKYGLPRSNGAANPHANERSGASASTEIPPSLVTVGSGTGTDPRTKSRSLRTDERTTSSSVHDPSPPQSKLSEKESHDRSSTNSAVHSRQDSRSTWVKDPDIHSTNGSGYGQIGTKTSHHSRGNEQSFIRGGVNEGRQRDNGSFSHRDAAYSPVNNQQRPGSISSTGQRISPAGSKRSSVASNSSGDSGKCLCPC